MGGPSGARPRQDARKGQSRQRKTLHRLFCAHAFESSEIVFILENKTSLGTRHLQNIDYSLSAILKGCLVIVGFLLSHFTVLLLNTWRRRSHAFLEDGLSCGVVFVHCKAISSTWNAANSSPGKRGFSSGSINSSRAEPCISMCISTHLTMSISAPKKSFVGILPLTSSISTIPML
ncbi:hypothetical protein HKD37_08G021395 [Glycine soja]